MKLCTHLRSSYNGLLSYCCLMETEPKAEYGYIEISDPSTKNDLQKYAREEFKRNKGVKDIVRPNSSTITRLSS